MVRYAEIVRPRPDPGLQERLDSPRRTDQTLPQAVDVLPTAFCIITVRPRQHCCVSQELQQ
ncbi:hypothetical protein PSMK_19900 [Phycisphaera mikurensis NBRC 102666]|uniref:Uncharacterized protein n=1 Tax=Phycisphaera mikurensis (strain NBRC 102666 / KCTC 22515 / FYK2301M01) TaxID=1142394 RepID=I0IFW1_PHYMF|nr:hypothetical protein PSMK_19900 [Phycisphaera mikurensis NBRC 102666]